MNKVLTMYQTLSQTFYRYELIDSALQSFEVDTIVIPLLWKRKLRHREVK